MDPFEYKGYWWVPGRKSRKKIVGTLVFSEEDGAKLELSGTLNGLEESINRNIVKVIPIIVGVTERGEKITLRRCYQQGARFGTGGFPTEEYGAHTVFVGEHFTTTSRIKLESLNVEYLHLREWADPKGGSFSRTHEQGFQYTYTIPDPVRFVCSALSEMQFEISFSCNIHNSRDEIRLREQTWCEMTPNKPMLYEQYDMALVGMQNFLALAVSHPVRPLSISGKVANGTYFVEFDGEKIARAKMVDIYFPITRMPYDNELLHEFVMMFTLKSVRDRIGTLVDNWFAKMAYLKPVYDLFFAVQRGTKLYSDNKFLFMAQALETYHRRAFNNNEVTQEAHDQRIKRILAGTPPEDRQWLEQKLQFSYEPSLRQRLKSLLGRHQSAVKHFISHPKVFIDKVVLTRNYLTHYDASLLDKAATNGADLYDLSQELKLLLELCLLDEIGFLPDELENFTQKRLRSGHHRLIPIEE